MRMFTRLLAVVATIACTIPAYADHLSGKYLFAARMNGAQQVPSVTTNALGLGIFHLNDTRDTLCFEMTATGLSGAITGIHIHEGATGVNGGVLVDLMPYQSGNRIKGTISGSTLTPSLVQKMFAGQLYLNLHTAANMNGEIRGQIIAEEDKGMAVMLNGANQVPAVATSATGMAFFMLQKHQGKLSFHIVADGLSGPITGAHLHQNVAGQNGGVVQDLMSFVSGNKISGSVNPAAYLNALMKDSLYINIHTAANPNGEIRGQLVVQPYVHFDAKLDTAQETTPVTGNGMGIGVAALRMNYTFDTLWYDAQVNGLTGAVADAHFHQGAINVSGGVLVGIPAANINGNVISGMLTGSTLTPAFVHQVLEGNVYLNIHTAANAGGEIRGQVYRTFREGYTYHLNGAQQSPMVTSTASGTGMVSVDRDQTNAHYMMVADGITGYSAAHFHNQVAGQNGAVLYDFSNMYSNGGIFGYWLDTDPNVAFTAAMSNKFRKDSVYVNIHTMTNANGEIRGNTSRKLCITIPQTVTRLGDIPVKTSLYPNPAQTSTALDITISANTHATIAVYDIMGRTVWTKEKDLETGVNRITIPMDNMTTGIYSVQVRNNTGQLSLKLIKN